MKCRLPEFLRLRVTRVESVSGADYSRPVRFKYNAGHLGPAQAKFGTSLLLVPWESVDCTLSQRVLIAPPPSASFGSM